MASLLLKLADPFHFLAAFLPIHAQTIDLTHVTVFVPRDADVPETRRFNFRSRSWTSALEPHGA
jgi:hypothetical protein